MNKENLKEELDNIQREFLNEVSRMAKRLINRRIDYVLVQLNDQGFEDAYEFLKFVKYNKIEDGELKNTKFHKLYIVQQKQSIFMTVEDWYVNDESPQGRLIASFNIIKRFQFENNTSSESFTFEVEINDVNNREKKLVMM